MIPLSLYVHIPWCARKCPYCDFNSHKSPTDIPEKKYIENLLIDLDNELKTLKPKYPLTSIFIGGGTPSIFSPDSYKLLLGAIKKVIPFTNDIEITMEMNPGTLDKDYLAGYYQAGINRLSIGVQSFNDESLKKLGRIHDAKMAQKSIEAAYKSGFTNINLDIMHGLPNQTITQGLDDLKQAISFKPSHLSWYQLTLEPNTVFYKKRPVLPSSEDCYELEKKGFGLLESNGYDRYEISAFALDNFSSRHNLNYWLFGDYLAIGAGAHGKYTKMAPNLIYRRQKRRLPSSYLNCGGKFLADEKKLSINDVIFEFMLNTTRLKQVITHKLFEEHTGLSQVALMPLLKQAEAKGFLFLMEDGWQVTKLGRRFLNDLQGMFLI